MAKQRNGWKLSSDSILNDMQEACVEHDYGGRCNSMDNDTRNIVSIDMRACNPASFPECEAKPYFERFGHRTNNIAHVSIKDPPPPFSRNRHRFFPGSGMGICLQLPPGIFTWFWKHFACPPGGVKSTEKPQDS